MSNIESLCEKPSYKTFIEDFKFVTKEQLKLKAQRVCIKVFIICLYMGICGVSSNYVFEVFFGNEVRDFPIYFIDFVTSLPFYIGLVLSGFISTSVAIVIHKLNVYAFSSPINSSIRVDRLMKVVQRVPELGCLVSSRMRNQGYVSEMDYQSLEIDTIHKELFD